MWMSSIAPVDWENSRVPKFVSFFTLFSIVESFMSWGPKKFVVAWETLMIIAKTGTLEIIEAFAVFPIAPSNTNKI